MSRAWPPLKRREVRAILKECGFVVVDSKGSHEKWRTTIKGQERNVIVDDYDEFDGDVLRSIVNQSGLTREEFYGATKKTSKKI